MSTSVITTSNGLPVRSASSASTPSWALDGILAAVGQDRLEQFALERIVVDDENSHSGADRKSRT